MSVVYTFAIAIALIFGIEVLSITVDNLYTSRKSWRSLQRVRTEIDNDIDLTASKKRHPAGKKR